MSEDEKVFDSLLVGGFIGTSLAILLKEDTRVGAIAGAVILATYRASEKAEKSKKVALVKVYNNKLYRVNPDGTKKYIKTLSNKKIKLPSKFTIT